MKFRPMALTCHSALNSYKQCTLSPLSALQVIPMHVPIILASGSATRAQMLHKAAIPFEKVMPRIDEEAIKSALVSEGAKPRDIADALAEAKARKIGNKHPEGLVIGCDQVLDHRGRLLSKPGSPDEAISQLTQLQADTHSLLSAAVIYEGGSPVWRHVGQVRLRMRPLSDEYIGDYVSRNWDSVRHSVGGYKLEEEGVRLFSGIDGSYFDVLGMPLTELLNYLILRGAIDA